MGLLPAGFRVDANEMLNILVAIIAITLALTFANGGIEIGPAQFGFLMVVFALTVGSGFVLHELAHKYFAVRYGNRARFEPWTWGLVLMLGLAIVPQLLGFGFFPLFLAPGAVMIYSQKRVSVYENGIISAAGPVTNIVLALLFLAASVMLFGTIEFYSLPVLDVFGYIMVMGMRVNMFLAMFNLLPIFPLDGSKVIAWNWKVWLFLFAVSFLGSGLFPF